MSRDADSRIRIHPAVVGEIRNVTATYRSRLGEIGSGWSRDGNSLHMDVRIPAGATATVLFPAAYRKSISVNGHSLRSDKKIRDIDLKGAAPQCVVVAGSYQFRLRR